MFKDQFPAAGGNYLMFENPDFNPKNVALVTSAGGEQGRSVCLAAAANGITTVGLDINQEQGLETMRQCRQAGGYMAFIKTDVMSASDLERAVATAACMGNLRYLINIVESPCMDYLEGFPLDTFDFLQRLTVGASLSLARLCMPYMSGQVQAPGVIANLTVGRAGGSRLARSALELARTSLRALSLSISAESKGAVRSFAMARSTVDPTETANQIMLGLCGPSDDPAGPEALWEAAQLRVGAGADLTLHAGIGQGGWHGHQ